MPRRAIVLLLVAGTWGCTRAAAPPPRSPAADAPPAARLAATPLAAAPPAAAGTPTATARPPATPEACRACDGDWGPHGLAGTVGCICRARDAGRRCRDDDECEGQCLGDAGESEVTDPGPPARGYFVGRCSELRFTFGCHHFIPAGAARAGPVPLRDPEQLCID